MGWRAYVAIGYVLFGLFVLWFAHSYVTLIGDINRKLREDAEHEIDQHGGT